VIDIINKDGGLIVIVFNSGKTYGYPKAVSWFQPISDRFKGSAGPYEEDRACEIWRKYGSFEHTLRPHRKRQRNRLSR
jgi:hypothetical protein